MSEIRPDSADQPSAENGSQREPISPAAGKDGPNVRAKALRMAGLGTELASYTLALAGVGYLVDSLRGQKDSYALAIGTLIGFTFGMIRFIQQVQKNT